MQRGILPTSRVSALTSYLLGQGHQADSVPGSDPDHSAPYEPAPDPALVAQQMT